jgi:SET domain-containing protein
MVGKRPTSLLDSASPIRLGKSRRRGRGVFATRDLADGEEVEQCPVIVVPAEEAEDVCATALGSYAYGWDDGAIAIALGFGSLYNHSTDPNATYEEGDDGKSLVIRADRPIAAGQEIFIDYTGGGAQPLWFDAV